MLEAHPFQLNWLSDDGDCALYVAAKGGHAAVVKMLLDFGLAIMHNVDYESYLDIAVKMVAKILLWWQFSTIVGGSSAQSLGRMFKVDIT